MIPAKVIHSNFNLTYKRLTFAAVDQTYKRWISEVVDYYTFVNYGIYIDKRVSSRENLSSGVSDKASFNPVSSTSETS